MNIKKITSLFLLSLFIPTAFSHDLERAVTSEERDPKMPPEIPQDTPWKH